MGIDVKGMTPLLQVIDMPTSVKFYCEVLGFEIVQDDGKAPADRDWVWLRLHDVDLMLNTAYDHDKRPPSPDQRRAANHLDTALFFGAPDVEAVYEHLRVKGIAVKEPRVAPYGMKQLYLQDPDDYNLCFQWKA